LNLAEARRLAGHTLKKRDSAVALPWGQQKLSQASNRLSTVRAQRQKGHADCSVEDGSAEETQSQAR
jgi:hypothetical protein